MRWLTAGILLLALDVSAAGQVRLQAGPDLSPSLVQALSARIAGLELVGVDVPAQARLAQGQVPESDGLPSFVFQVPYRLMADSGACRCTGVPLEPDPADQLWLLRRLLPQAKRVGVLLHPDNGWQRQRLERAAKSLALSLRFQELESGERLSEVLAQLLPRVDALMLLPDERLFNADTAKLLLLTGYRQNCPLIGPDRGFVNAGSLASVYVTEEAVVETLANLIHRWLGAGQLPAQRFAPGAVAVNEHVARSYGVQLPADLGELQQELEGRP